MTRSVTILYGTETFTAEGYAERTGEALSPLGYACDVIDMEDFDPDQISSLKTLLIVTSTYGNGDPPASAEPLFDSLMADNAARLNGLRFSVCGLGDTTYPRFAQCGKDFDRRLAELGGARFADRKDCDVDVDPFWEDWLTDVKAGLEALDWTASSDASSDDTSVAPPEPTDTPAPVGASAPVDASDPAEIAPAEGAVAQASAMHLQCGPPSKDDATPGSRRHPVLGSITVNRSMTGDSATRDVRHIELDMSGRGLSWEPGDSIGFFAPNDPALVDAILEAAGADGQTSVDVKTDQMSLRDAMLTRLDVHTADGRLADAILAAGGKVLAPAGADVHVLDALLNGGVAIGASALHAAMRRQAPRLYSVASSQLLKSDTVDLVASIVRYDAYGRARSGVATGWMADRLPEGCQVRAYVHPQPEFRLADDGADIIMIGPGTGVAPFRGFLQERALRRARGRSWLFFGSRNRATDYLYGDELESWRHRGVLTRLDLAFSRDQDEKVYVQHKMLDHAKALWSWIESGAVIYVCGDAEAMAPDVHRTLQQIACEQGGMAADEARTWIRELAQSGRYKRDVY
jgi:sulfite reductase (NADPH) flavoprotein alpha-component